MEHISILPPSGERNSTAVKSSFDGSKLPGRQQAVRLPWEQAAAETISLH